MKKLIFPLLLVGSAYHIVPDARQIKLPVKKSTELRAWTKKPVSKKYPCPDFGSFFIAGIADGF